LLEALNDCDKPGRDGNHWWRDRGDLKKRKFLYAKAPGDGGLRFG
jgi:hypothetical protein